MASKYVSCEAAQDITVKGEDTVVCTHPANCYFKRQQVVDDLTKEVKDVCIKERDNG